jgi:hypothetical protein
MRKLLIALGSLAALGALNYYSGFIEALNVGL